MSLPRLRRRVDVLTFASWRAGLPGLAVPAWIGPGPGLPAPAGAPRGVTVPPMAGAALAVVNDPRVSVLFAVRGGAPASTGCVALADEVAAALVRHEPVDEAAWVEIALIPVERAVDEVVRWLPPDPADGRLLVAHLARPGEPPGWSCRWTARGGSWHEGEPGDHPAGPADVVDRLRSALCAGVAGRPAGPRAPVGEP